MKIRVTKTGVVHRFEKPVFNISIINTGGTKILINGDTDEDAIVLLPSNKKSLGFAGLEEIYFANTDDEDGFIEITSVEYLKPIFRGSIDTNETLLDFRTLAHGISVKNLSGNDLYISINKKIQGDTSQSYKIMANEVMQLEQNIEKVWLLSEGSSVYELYAYRKPGTAMSY